MKKAILVECSQIEKNFGVKKALNKVNLKLLCGEIFLLLGENGAGKSTLCKILALLSKQSSGKIFHKGNEIKGGYRKEYKKVLGYLSHQTFLYDNLTAQENLNFFAGIYNIENKKERIDELMDNFGVYDSRNLLVGAFSRGMAQRLSLAKVFLNDPKILLLDEPFTGLDPNALENISGILYKLKSPDRTILVVTHEIDDTVEIADRFAILKDGENVYSGSFYSKDDLKRAYFEHTAR